MRSLGLGFGDDLGGEDAWTVVFPENLGAHTVSLDAGIGFGPFLFEEFVVEFVFVVSVCVEA